MRWNRPDNSPGACPAGWLATWKRDAEGRPTDRRVFTGAHPGRSQGRDVMHTQYAWASPDQIGALVDALHNRRTSYDYDPRGHLTKQTLPDGEVIHRKSDAVGNLFRTPDMSDAKYGPGGVLQSARGTDYQHDGHGNLIEKRLADGATWRYRWNHAGRLAEVERPDGKKVTFAYDPLGRRIEKRFDGRLTEYLWDGDDLVHERTRTADGEFEPLVSWVFDPESFAPLAKQRGSERLTFVTDHLGAPTMLATEAGAIAWQAQLDVYGVPRDSSGSEDPESRFPGQLCDEETGLYYNRHRYYDPETGRYISEDPIGLSGDLALFSYVSDPLMWLDPGGLKRCNIPKSTKVAMGPKPSDMLNPHRHHIVMEGLFRHWKPENRAFVEGARDILKKHGIDLHGTKNVVWAQNAGHSKAYAKKVHDALKDASDKGGKRAVEKKLKDLAEGFG